MATQGFSARTNYFRCDLDQLRQLLVPYPNIEIRSRDDDDEIFYAIGTTDPMLRERRDDMLELAKQLAAIIDERDTLLAISVSYNGMDTINGRATILNRQGVVRRVDLNDIYRLAGEAGIALNGAED